MQVVNAWAGGFWNLLSFSMQMAMVVLTGHAMASAPAFKRKLAVLAGIAKTPGQAIILVTVISALACWINWGFGLVVGAIFARVDRCACARRGLSIADCLRLQWFLILARWFIGLYSVSHCRWREHCDRDQWCCDCRYSDFRNPVLGDEFNDFSGYVCHHSVIKSFNAPCAARRDYD